MIKTDTLPIKKIGRLSQLFFVYPSSKTLNNKVLLNYNARDEELAAIAGASHIPVALIIVTKASKRIRVNTFWIRKCTVTMLRHFV